MSNANLGGWQLVGAVAAELRSTWKMMLGIVLLFSAAFTTVAFTLSPVYRAEVLLAPMQPDVGGLAQMLGPLGGIADFAGLGDLGDSDGVSALAVLKSRDLGMEFIRNYELASELIERKGWRKRVFGAASDTSEEQRQWDAYENFDGIVRAVIEDRRTGLVTLAFKWSKAEALPVWLNNYVALCNDRLKRLAIDDAAQQLQYLREQLEQTNSVEVRQALNRLIEARLKEMAVAQTRNDYAFRTVDPPVIPQERASPRRGSLLVVGVLVGLFVCIGIALIRAARIMALRR
jgi:uncharacterized protein involved in exopolysaccharide biosynthesis